MAELTSPLTLLVLYDSRYGSTMELARQVARGAKQAGAEVLIRTVPGSRSADYPSLELAVLNQIDALAVGSPGYFGCMSANMKAFWEATSSQWLTAALEGKPAGVFTSTGSMHGGHETTLLSLGLPLLHHGMLWVGLPYSEPSLHTTMGGGAPYGAGAVTELNHQRHQGLIKDEKTLAQALGIRLVTVAQQLRDGTGE